MNITEKAKQYAQGKAIDALTAVIEQAYVNGYNDGLNHLENEKLEAAKAGITFKNLDLPSGIAWSDGYVKDVIGFTKMMSYTDASKLDIPNIEDFKELVSNCPIQFINETRFHGLKFILKNGEEIKLHYERHQGQSDAGINNVIFWLKGVEDGNERNFACIYGPNKWVVAKTYMGYKLPVMLVKKEK